MPRKIIGIILTFNNQLQLEETYKRIPLRVFDAIFVCDDGSTDGTLKIAKKLKIKSFTHKNWGYGGNLKYGMKKALTMDGDYIVEIHGDGQYEIEKIPDCIKKITKNHYDLLQGSRFIKTGQARKDGMPLARFLANIALTKIANIILGTEFTEVHSGFRIYSEKITELALKLKTSLDNVFTFEIVAMTVYYKLKVGEMPIRCDYKASHSSLSYIKSVKYSIKLFYVLIKFVLARMNFKSEIFSRLFNMKVA